MLVRGNRNIISLKALDVLSDVRNCDGREGVSEKVTTREAIASNNKNSRKKNQIGPPPTPCTMTLASDWLMTSKQASSLAARS